jgi:hypothetical protein
MTWRTLAACDGSSVDFFDHNQAEHALAICAGCDVREPCLADALDRGDRMGVRGGFNLEDMPKQKRGPKFQPIAHGTERGYKAHYRRGEKACDECRESYNRLAQARRQARRERVA